LISYFFGYVFDKVEELPITFYRRLLEQAMNIGNLLRQGEFKMQTDEEIQDTALAEYNQLINSGRINWKKK